MLIFPEGENGRILYIGVDHMELEAPLYLLPYKTSLSYILNPAGYSSTVLPLKSQQVVFSAQGPHNYSLSDTVIP